MSPLCRKVIGGGSSLKIICQGSASQKLICSQGDTWKARRQFSWCEPKLINCCFKHCMSNTEYEILWAEVTKAYLPYRLRRESQSMFRDPKDEWLDDSVYSDAELSILLNKAASLTERFLFSLQVAEMRLQEVTWRFCAHFYRLEPNLIIEFGALERSLLQVQRLSIPHDDADLGELDVHGSIISVDKVVKSREFWFRLDMIPWWHVTA